MDVQNLNKKNLLISFDYCHDCCRVNIYDECMFIFTYAPERVTV